MIQGKKYYVSEYSEANALQNKRELEFACYSKAAIMYFHTTVGDLASYRHAVEIPEAEYIPWTMETFPKDKLVWTRQKGRTDIALCNYFDGADTGQYLLSEREWLQPDSSFSPCGVKTSG